MFRSKGLLLVTMEPPASLEDEFNDWYDTEHFPQRRGLPGFESASRWVCIEGWPRWAALYDLESVGVLARLLTLVAVSGWSGPSTLSRIARARSIERPGLGDRPASKQAGEVVEARGGVGMVGAERLLADRQGALVERLGLGGSPWPEAGRRGC